MIVEVQVGFTSRRPIVPDEHTAYVKVEASDDIDAMLLAAQIVATWPPCVMVTSTKLLV